ncbi:MFS transporter [uncultured Eubacterium sp.]|uniref:MFS transporter n=1 Tax=uncultured Eubacterium sp. TaxID=165185 RepID=UPI0025CDA591|nr:MFS transporter [uncultured Eubacterium sp.]
MSNNGSKVKGLFTEIKTHWKTPAKGKYVPYREYLDILFGVGANYAGNKTLEYISFAAGCYLMMYHYKLPYLTYAIITLINMPLNYIWVLIGWVINDNLGFLPKKTERNFNILYLFLTVAGLGLIFGDFSAFLPETNKVVAYLNGLEGITAASAIKIFGTHILWNGWAGARNIFWRKKLVPKFGRYKYSLYCDVIPKTIMVWLIGWLPFYSTITDISTRVWVANLLFSIYNLFTFNNNLETCTQNISPNMRERIFVRSYPIKLSHLFQSILAIILPAIIDKCPNDWADIAVFKWIIPVTFTVFAVLTMVFAGKIKERIPQPPLEKKVKINFWDGMFGVLRNKYRWIQTIVGLLDSLGNGMLAFTTILYLYTFRLTGLTYSLIVALVSFAGTPPDLFTPYFIKRFSYKQVMIFYQLSRAVCYSVIVCCYLFCGENLILCGTLSVIMLFITEMFQTVPKSINHDMDIRVNDYQMYLSGERLESFAGVFGWFTGPITSFVGLIIPLLLLKFGFNTNWDVLFIDSSRTKIIVVPIIIDIIGYLLMTIPFIFWDYTDDKQSKVMEVLRKREEVTRKAYNEEHGIKADAVEEEKELEEVVS